VFECEENAELEDYVSLALAADHFLMEPLRKLCCSKIEKMVTVKNVWRTLNSACFAPKVSVACSKVIFEITIVSLYFQIIFVGAFF